MQELILVLAGLLVIGQLVKLKFTKYSFEKQLRKTESPIEEKLMKKLHEHGLKPYAQIPCGPYRIDIALYVKGRRIAVECDGEEFHSRLKQRIHDEEKDYFLQKNKWHVLRFTGKEIHNNANACVEKIKSYI